MAEGSSIGYLFDENVSPKLVSILRNLGEPGLYLVVRVFGYGAKDSDWLPRVAEYGYICVTCDRRQLADERIARVVQAARGRAVFLPSQFAQARRWDQALWLLRHWPRIKEATTGLVRGEVRFVRWNGRVSDRPAGWRPRFRRPSPD